MDFVVLLNRILEHKLAAERRTAQAADNQVDEKRSQGPRQRGN
jgi:hypothetical protein